MPPASAGQDANAPRKPIDVIGIFPEIRQIADAKLRDAVVEIWEELWARSAWNDIDTVPTSPEIERFLAFVESSERGVPA